MIRGKIRGIPPHNNKEIKASIHNEFNIEVIDARTGKMKNTVKAYNVICNQWWTKQFSNNYPVSYIHYGTGSGTPSASDTSLFSYLGGKSVADDSWGMNPDNGVIWKRFKIQLSETEAVGAEITEVGIAYGSTSTNLCTHAMLQDMNGNHVSIVKSNTDIINIYATVFAHWDVADLIAKGITLKPSSNLATCLCGRRRIADMTRCMYIRAESGRGAYIIHPNTASAKRISGSYAYDVTNRKVTQTYTRLAAGSYNLNGGIAAIGFGFEGNEESIMLFVENGISEQLPPHKITGESIGTGDGVITDYQTIFPLLQEATVYVDGVAQENVVIDLNKPSVSYSAFGLQMNMITERGNPTFDRAPNYSSYHISGNEYGYSYYYDTKPRFAENPFWESIGISKISPSGYYGSDRPINVAVSNDLNEWIDVFSLTSYSGSSVPEAYQNYRYWRFNGHDTKGWTVTLTANITDTKNIHFASPPAEGSVITVDYTTKVIPKDTNHVFDMKLSIQLNEYTGVQ